MAYSKYGNASKSRASHPIGCILRTRKNTIKRILILVPLINDIYIKPQYRYGSKNLRRPAEIYPCGKWSVVILRCHSDSYDVS